LVKNGWCKIKAEVLIMTLRRASNTFLLFYALLTIYPIISILVGISPWHLLTPVATLAGFTFALLHAGQREGWWRAVWLVLLVFIVSLTFESVGVATGWIYGPYHYTNSLGPLFLGLVPYLIPVAWFMMSYPSFVIADRLIPGSWKRWQRIFSVAAVGGLVMTAWDVVMDPIMVASGHWVWDIKGAFHGIPLQNYWGWWLTIFTTFALYMLVSGDSSRPAETSGDLLALSSYLITALGIIVLSLVTGAGELALIGFFSMAPWIVAGWLKMLKP
jgi:putative membrane protein